MQQLAALRASYSQAETDGVAGGAIMSAVLEKQVLRTVAHGGNVRLRKLVGFIHAPDRRGVSARCAQLDEEKRGRAREGRLGRWPVGQSRVSSSEFYD